MHTQSNLESSEIPTKQWVQERQHYIGGSEIAAILGESTYSTPLQVWMKKKGLVSPSPGTPITDFGHVFEPIMSEYFEDLTGLKTRRVNTPFIDNEHDFLRANIDRQILNAEGVDGTGILELKTTNSHRLKSLDGRYPLSWEYQVQWYLGITSYNYGYLFIYERDTCEFYEPIFIERDEELIGELQRRVTQWWNTHMIGGKRPAPQNEEDLLILYPYSSDGKVIEASPTAFQLYKELVEVRENKKALAEDETRLKNLLKDEIGDAERMVLRGNTLLTWKSYSRTRLDAKKLREDKPELYAKYQTETSYRRFSVK